ncbi:MAG TPA: helix-turn-helix transcriptional regulator [Solirubrobacteraceae bacterium]|nr:helix-turn-helix transcriptional regulator [Solirubrobacteraceae bacterium]
MSNPPVVEVSEMLVLAAVERAQRHSGSGAEGVPVWEVLGHLDIKRRTKRARRVRGLLGELEESGSLKCSRRRSVSVWTLTGRGRRRLSRARRAGRLPVLGESPQHRRWREARGLAERRIEGFRGELLDLVEHAEELLAIPAPASPAPDGQGAALGVCSDVWFEVGERLQRACGRLGSASYCLWEWREPEDSRADIDDLGGLGDEVLDARRRAVRRARRGGRRNTLLWDSHPELVSLGWAVRQLREERGMSVGELAGKTGIGVSCMASLEAGRLDPDYELLGKLADALDTKLSALVIRGEAPRGNRETEVGVALTVRRGARGAERG